VDSVAVIPFVNRSASEENAYFADGIHDDLLAYLSDNDSIRVISRTSVQRYRDTENVFRMQTEIAQSIAAALIIC